MEETAVSSVQHAALDAYVAKAYWNLDAKAMPYLKMANERNLGTPDFEKLRIQAVSVS